MLRNKEIKGKGRFSAPPKKKILAYRAKCASKGDYYARHFMDSSKIESKSGSNMAVAAALFTYQLSSTLPGCLLSLTNADNNTYGDTKWSDLDEKNVHESVPRNDNGL